jgi:hypothetical protein
LQELIGQQRVTGTGEAEIHSQSGKQLNFLPPLGGLDFITFIPPGRRLENDEQKILSNSVHPV